MPTKSKPKKKQQAPYAPPLYESAYNKNATATNEGTTEYEAEREAVCIADYSDKSEYSKPSETPDISDKRFRIRWQYSTATMMLSFGCILALLGFFFPEPGEIGDSIIWIFSQCLIYAGSVFGISTYVNDRLRSIPKK